MADNLPTKSDRSRNCERDEHGAIRMMRKGHVTASAKHRRYRELRAMLESRRLELAHDVRGRIRGARTDNSNDHEVFDEGEVSEIDIQDGIQFALIQMKAETLEK